MTVLASQFIATAGLDHLVKIWHVPNGSLQDGCEVKRKLKVPADVKALKYCPKSGVLAVSCTDGSVNVHHLKISQLLNDSDDAEINEDDIDIDELDDAIEESKELPA